MKKDASYIFSADVIRSLAILGVIAIHTANSVFDRPDFFGGISWWFAIIINSLSRICIPLFIMLSGYLILRKDVGFGDMFKRAISLLLIPLVTWTILNTLINNGEPISFLFSLPFVLKFFSGDVSYLYYLIILIGLYLISPLLRSYLKNNSILSQKYLALFFVILGMGKIGTDYLLRSCETVTSLTMWVPYVGFFLIGYLIATQKLKFKNSFTKAVYLSSLAVTIGLNYLFYLNARFTGPQIPIGCITHYSDYYLSINVFLMSAAAFVLLFNLDYKFLKNEFLRKQIYNLARASFGIYLIHLFIVNAWDKKLFWDVDNTSLPLWLYIIVKFLGVFIISYLLTVIIDKIPIVRYVIGGRREKK